jgi:hypothetical protein
MACFRSKERNTKSVPHPLRIALEIDGIVFHGDGRLSHLQSEEARLRIVIGCERYVRQGSLNRCCDLLACIRVRNDPVHRTLAIRVTASTGDNIGNLLVAALRVNRW